MDFPESFNADLDMVVKATGHARFRELVDPSHPAHNPDYVPFVIRMAAELRGEVMPEPTPPRPDRVKVVPAHPYDLSAEENAEVMGCTHRREVQSCCGPMDVCDLGRGSPKVDTALCCGCVLAGLPR